MIIAVLTAERDAALAEVETWKRRYHKVVGKSIGWQERAERAEQALRPFAGMCSTEPPTTWDTMQRNILAARTALDSAQMSNLAATLIDEHLEILALFTRPNTCQWTNFWDQIDNEAPRETCDQPATHTACTPKVGVVCEKHKCRCSKPLT